FVYVAANKEQMVRLATRIADGLMLGDTTEQRLGSSLDLIGDNLASHGRSRKDLVVSCLVAWHVKENRKVSISEARRHLALRGMLDAWFLATFLDEDECRIVEANRQNIYNAYKQKTDRIDGVSDEIIDKLVDNLSMSGDYDNLDRHTETLRRYREMGLDEVAFKLHEDQDAAIRAIGERVLPAL
ncbi:MAG: LLM class flavin-dependent oxidoreductase, partial [Kiloniellales bacterium]|nr:LLM class flavin-dependent oxidoreductase [Kiloniellales bacterium]